jgi:pimeloyl-ACP methyl ester carboxylesterase
MFMVPIAILPFWLLAVWSFGLVGGGAYLFHEWYERSWRFDPVRDTYFFHPVLGWNTDSAYLAAGIALVLFAFIGGAMVRPLLRLFMRSAPEECVNAAPLPDAVATRGAASVTKRLRRSNGSQIQVEIHGPDDGIPIVLSHGWGTNRREWEYLRRELSGSHYRLITWDLPGLGGSDEPPGRDYRLENFAQDLDLVLRETCGNRPAVLAGHSIGGMTTLTFCRLFPEALGTRVAGLVLGLTTYINPVRTAKGGGIYTILEKPLLVPLLYLTIALSPLLRLAGWMSYHNGSAYISALIGGFAGTQSFEQLDFSTRFILQAPPAVLARGMLGMLQYDATETLKTIPIPALIIAGEQDTSCRIEASQRMAREIPQATLISLSPANHMGLVEQQKVFAAGIREFVARLASPSVPS